MQQGSVGKMKIYLSVSKQRFRIKRCVFRLQLKCNNKKTGRRTLDVGPDLRDSDWENPYILRHLFL
jgi:hypothetical protein